MITTTTILFAFFGGLIPAMIWLTFWLREDDEHPEPRRLIFLTFVFGMLAAPIALLIQMGLDHVTIGNVDIHDAMRRMPLTAFVLVVLWATTEEVVKYFAAKFGGLSKPENDEPMDNVIYMITAALGFAAVENALYLLGPIVTGDTELAIQTGNMRFIGATLLHVSASAMIGIFRAFSHFKLKEIKKRYTITGVILAITLHTLFNFSIIVSKENAFLAFSSVWILTIIVILLFERIKNLHIEKIE